MNCYEKLIDLLVAVIIMFLFPVIYFTKKSELIEYHTIYNWMGEWVEEACTQGKITKVSMEELYRLINSFNEPVELTISYETTCYEPVYKKGLMEKEPSFTGSIHTFQKVYPMNEIMKKLKEESEFRLQYNGYLTVSVRFIKDNQTIYEGGNVRADVSLRDSICYNRLSFYCDSGYYVE